MKKVKQVWRPKVKEVVLVEAKVIDATATGGISKSLKAYKS